MPLLTRAAPMLATVLLAVTACASDAAPGAEPAISAARGGPPALVTIDRSGGFAGIHQRMVVDESGAWTVTGPAGAERTGRLSPDQLGSLRQLIDGTSWAGGSRSPSPAECPDGYVYVVAVGRQTATADDCTLDGLPALGAIVTSVTNATG